MILQSASASSFFEFSQCPCGNFANTLISSSPETRRNQLIVVNFRRKTSRRKLGFFRACAISGGDGPAVGPNMNVATIRRAAAKNLVLKRFASELDAIDEFRMNKNGSSSNFISSFQEDPFVDKLRTQLGVIHPMPSPPINRNIVGLIVFFFFVGVGFDKFWTSKKSKKSENGGAPREAWPQVPTSFSLFLEKDLPRKESVDWVNMVLGKLWKVYRAGLENWLIGLLQPVIDDLKKPDYV